jgi:hypothetical protein
MRFTDGPRDDRLQLGILGDAHATATFHCKSWRGGRIAARDERATAERMRRIGIIWNVAADDPEAQARLTAFEQALRQRGWTDGRNVHMDMRWNSIKIERARRYAAELLALSPDIILVATLRLEACRLCLRRRARCRSYS